LCSLEGLKRMDEVAVECALRAYFIDVRSIFTDALTRARLATGSKNAVEANSKFDGFEGSFASLKDFHAGAEATLKLGYPNPDTEKGIRLEHTVHPSAERLFVTANYRIATNLVIEYWWAVDPSALQDSRVPKMLSELSSKHLGSTVRQPLLFPGEIGDSFQESLVLISLPRDVDLIKVTKAVQEVSGEGYILRDDEEKARGITILDNSACLEWITTSTSILQANKPRNIHSLAADTVLMGLMLPMSLPSAETRIAVLQAAVDTAIGGGAHLVPLELKACKTWTFCRHTGVEALRKKLKELSLEDLRKHARDDWGVSVDIPADSSRDRLTRAVATSFVCTDLRADLRSALSNADEAQVKHLLGQWCEPSGLASSSLHDQAAEALESEEQWRQVEGWVGLFQGRLQGRTRLGLERLMEREYNKIKRFGLEKSETLALYLYTGPEFFPMNSILRSFPQSMLNLLDGNRMCTTLFCISSGLKKLSRFTDLVQKVYRGLGSMILPAQFWVPHGNPKWRGGVERAFMSTTADKGVALFYANGRGTVVEISVGRIQIGGDVSFLSMVSGAPPSPQV
jgi:hypothetical protein